MAITNMSTITQAVHDIAPKYDVNRIALFGSYAKGDYSASSDVDIVLDTGSEFSLFDAARMRTELSEALGTDVDIVSRASLYEPIATDILENQVFLYER